MKRMRLFLIALIALTSFWACSDDDESFKAPELGGGTNLTQSISKDTANTYKIVLNVKSEAGLQEIVLTNKADGKELNKVTSFANPNDYNYSYDMDLTSYKSNTEVVLTLSIKDVAGNVTSQEIKLTVIVPEVKIYFQTEDEELSTYFDMYYLPFKVKCGLATLKSVVVDLNGVKSTLEIKPKIEDSFYFEFYAENLNDGKNTVVINVEDNNGRSAEISIKIIKKDAPVGLGDAYLVTPLSKEFGGFVISSGIKDGKISWFRCEYYDEVMDMMGMKMPLSYFDSYDFIYNSNNTINKLVYTFNDGMGTENHTVFEYKYKADNAQQLDQIITYAGSDDAGNKADGAEETVYANNFEYELGYIIKYNVKGKEYTPKYLTVEGEQVRVDRLDYSATEASEYVLTERIENPLYNQFCPAVVTVGTEKLPLDMFFYNKYLFSAKKQGGSVIQYTIEKNATNQAEKVIWEGQDTEIQYTYE